jgi:hypothetical protein
MSMHNSRAHTPLLSELTTGTLAQDNDNIGTHTNPQGRETCTGMPFYGPGYVLRKGPAGRLAFVRQLTCPDRGRDGRGHIEWIPICEVLEDAHGEQEDAEVTCEAAWEVKWALEAWLQPEEELVWDEEPETEGIVVCVSPDL